MYNTSVNNNLNNNNSNNTYAYYTSGNYEMLKTLPEINLKENFVNYTALLLTQVIEEGRGVAAIKKYAPEFIIKKILKCRKVNMSLKSNVRRAIDIDSKIHLECRAKAFTFSKIKFGDGSSDTYMLTFTQYGRGWMIYNFDSLHSVVINDPDA